MKASVVLSVMGVLLVAAMPAWSAEPEAARSQSVAPAPAGAEPSTASGQAAAEEGAAPIIDDDAAPPVTDEGVPPVAEPDAPLAAGAEKPATLGKLPGADEDQKLEKEIQGAFRKDPDLKNNRIAVTVDNCNTDAISTDCNITLAGAVDNQAERVKAEQVARVKGVVLIHNLLDLGAGVTDGIPDGAVTAKVRELLLADPAFKSSIISITTTRGVVTLVGTVPSDSVRQQAADKARQARAVKRVENALRVQPDRYLARRGPSVIQRTGDTSASDRP